MNTHLKQAQAIFEELLDSDPSQVEKHLETACQGDHELLKTVRELWVAHQTAHDRMTHEFETHVLQLLDTHIERSDKDQAVAHDIVFQKNRYRVIGQIGSGGMSSVYLCERDHDGYQQKIAIKILKRMDLDATLKTRFTQEKHILAQLVHPNITQFIDTDYLEDGTPFVVMEYTPGENIVQHCKNNGLGVEECLKLFLQLCHAVQYAHQNLIIHRDIKPNNVVVTESGVVKLLDFGIAKFIEKNDLMETKTGHYVMTPAYASPEQIRKTTLNVTTDVYSLGLVLYELLTGSRPYDIKHMSPGEYEAGLFKGDIELPSKRATRHNKHIQGDLDSITLKAIQPEIKHRYQSVGELINDIEGHQQSLPVLAHSPNFFYKASRFLKRNRIPVATAAAFAVMVILFVVQINSEKERSEQERHKAEIISDSFILAFKNADPTNTLGEEIKAIHILDQSSNIIKNQYQDNPQLFTDLSLTMAQVYYNMGSYPQALAIIKEAERHNQVLSSEQAAAQYLLEANIRIKNEEYGDAQLAINQAPDTPQTKLQKQIAQTNVLIKQGHLDDAKNLMASINTELNTDNELYFEACLSQADLITASGDDEQQVLFLNQCLNNKQHSSYNDSWGQIKVMLLLAKSSQRRKNFDASNRYYLEALEMQKSLFGEQHISMIDPYKGLGWNLMQQLDFPQSTTYQNQALAISEKYHGKGHPNTSNAIYNLGHVYSNQEQFEQAFDHYQRAIDIMLQHGLTEETKLAFYYKSYGHLQNDRGMYKEAEKNIKNSIAIFAIKQGSYIYRVAEMEVLLSHIYHNQGRDEEARQLLAKALPLMYTMHKAGDHYQVLGEELDAQLNDKTFDGPFTILKTQPN